MKFHGAEGFLGWFGVEGGDECINRIGRSENTFRHQNKVEQVSTEAGEEDPHEE